MRQKLTTYDRRQNHTVCIVNNGSILLRADPTSQLKTNDDDNDNVDTKEIQKVLVSWFLPQGIPNAHHANNMFQASCKSVTTRVSTIVVIIKLCVLPKGCTTCFTHIVHARR